MDDDRIATSDLVPEVYEGTPDVSSPGSSCMKSVVCMVVHVPHAAQGGLSCGRAQ